jgi:hypothetical protein
MRRRRRGECQGDFMRCNEVGFSISIQTGRIARPKPIGLKDMFLRVFPYSARPRSICRIGKTCSKGEELHCKQSLW